MSRTKKRIIKTVSCLLLVVLFAMQAHADTTSQKITDTEEQMQESQKKLKETQQSIQDIEDTKARLEGNLAELNNELNEVSTELTNLEKELAVKQVEIEALQTELEAAQVREQEQYESMKMRIKYMYEMKDTAFLELMMQIESIADMLNKAEYFSKITEYDRDMLEQYQEIKNTIEQTKISIEQEETELQRLITQVDDKQQKVALLVTQTSAEVAKQANDLDTAEQKALEYEEELRARQDTLESLKEQEALEKAIREAEEKARREAQAKAAQVKAEGKENVPDTSSGDTSGYYAGYNVVTTNAGYEMASQSSDLALLAAIIHCESEGEPYEGKLAVGSVVMNRITSQQFPNTMLGVLYQRIQFTPVTSGRFAIILAKGSASSDSVRAAKEVLSGVNTMPDCLFFRTVIPGRAGTIIGNHVFY